MDIDTRSDIYSLGVLLYEILTGSTPFASSRLRSAAWHEIQRIIREEDPPIPSTRASAAVTTGSTQTAVYDDIEPAKLASVLKGDLDWIVMKAMDKDRTRRYSTAKELADDVSRHMRDEPVLASPPSVMYRVRKFAKRHRGAMVAASLAVATLLVGLATTTGTMMWALRERARAQEATIRAEDQAARAKRFAAVAGTPHLSPNHVKSFYDAWQNDMEQLRASTHPNDPELVRQEGQLAAWSFFHSMVDNLDMRKEATERIYEYYPHAREVLGVKDELIASLGVAYVNAKLAEPRDTQQAQSNIWLATPRETLEELEPIYADLAECWDANLPPSSQKLPLLRLERAIVLFLIGREDEAEQLMNSYLVWRHMHDLSSSRLVANAHDRHIETITQMLDENEEYKKLREMFASILDDQLLQPPDSDRSAAEPAQDESAS